MPAASIVGFIIGLLRIACVLLARAEEPQTGDGHGTRERFTRIA